MLYTHVIYNKSKIKFYKNRQPCIFILYFVFVEVPKGNTKFRPPDPDTDRTVLTEVSGPNVTL